jgi:hypothetical protein
LEEQATAGVAVIVNGDDALRSLPAQVGNADAKRSTNGVNCAVCKTVQENTPITFGYGQRWLGIIVGRAIGLPLTVRQLAGLAAFGVK